MRKSLAMLLSFMIAVGTVAEPVYAMNFENETEVSSSLDESKQNAEDKIVENADVDASPEQDEEEQEESPEPEQKPEENDSEVVTPEEKSEEDDGENLEEDSIEEDTGNEAEKTSIEETLEENESDILDIPTDL